MWPRENGGTVARLYAASSEDRSFTFICTLKKSIHRFALKAQVNDRPKKIDKNCRNVTVIELSSVIPVY